MSWFIELQGSTHQGLQSTTHELQDAVDVDKLAQELSSAVVVDRAVAVPAMLAKSKGRRQKVTFAQRGQTKPAGHQNPLMGQQTTSPSATRPRQHPHAVSARRTPVRRPRRSTVDDGESMAHGCERSNTDRPLLRLRLIPRLRAAASEMVDRPGASANQPRIRFFSQAATALVSSSVRPGGPCRVITNVCRLGIAHTCLRKQRYTGLRDA